jgi:hypothetical protein
MVVGIAKLLPQKTTPISVWESTESGHALPGSFDKFHPTTQNSTQDDSNMFWKYRLALQLYKTFNNRLPETEWVHLNYVQTNARRKT